MIYVIGCSSGKFLRNKAYITWMRYILLSLLLLLTLTTSAQKKAQIEFQVSGVCEMCEARIEKALDVSGVIIAEWNVETKRVFIIANQQNFVNGWCFDEHVYGKLVEVIK